MGRGTTRSIGMDQTLSCRPEGGGDGVWLGETYCTTGKARDKDAIT